MDFKNKYLKYKQKYINLKKVDSWSQIMNTQLFRDDIESIMGSQGKTFDDAVTIAKKNIIENDIKRKDYYRNTRITDAMYNLNLVPEYNFPYSEYGN